MSAAVTLDRSAALGGLAVSVGWPASPASQAGLGA